MTLRRLRLALSLAVTVSLIGCGPASFKARGRVTSVSGKRRDRWSSAPLGCSRDPSDGLPPDTSRTLATLLWVDPAHYDYKLDNRDTAPDAPMMLDIVRADPASGAPVSFILRTRYRAGIVLDNSVCSALEASSSEQPPQPPMVRPSLSGSVRFDCQANNSHITGNVSFQHCEY